MMEFKFIRREVRKGDNNKKIGKMVGVKMITPGILEFFFLKKRNGGKNCVN